MPVTRLRLSALDADELERLLRRHLGGQLERLGVEFTPDQRERRRGRAGRAGTDRR